VRPEHLKKTGNNLFQKMWKGVSRADLVRMAANASWASRFNLEEETKNGNPVSKDLAYLAYHHATPAEKTAAAAAAKAIVIQSSVELCLDALTSGVQAFLYQGLAVSSAEAQIPEGLKRDTFSSRKRRREDAMTQEAARLAEARRKEEAGHSSVFVAQNSQGAA